MSRLNTLGILAKDIYAPGTKQHKFFKGNKVFYRVHPDLDNAVELCDGFQGVRGEYIGIFSADHIEPETPLQRTQREHDKKRAGRSAWTKKAQFKSEKETLLFEALLEQSGETHIGILRKWMAAKLVV